MSHQVTRSQSHKNFWLKFSVNLLVTWCLGVLVTIRFSNAYALNLDKLKVYFLNGDYKSVISDGEKLLSSSDDSSSNLDELYYILGLGYLKDSDSSMNLIESNRYHLRASDIFEIILKEFKDSRFKEAAEMGLGDTYFLRGYYVQAQMCYQNLLNRNPSTELLPPLYYRLSRCALKKGDTIEAKEYRDKLALYFPLSFEAQLNKESYGSGFDYAVQVGSFTNSTNARNLCDKLINKGYEAYVQEAYLSGIKIYRVKVGKLKSHLQAVQLKDELITEGYPAKIVP